MDEQTVTDLLLQNAVKNPSPGLMGRPPRQDVGTTFARGWENSMLGAQQGVAPTPEKYQRVDIESLPGSDQTYFYEQRQNPDPEKYLVFVTPEGKKGLYYRPGTEPDLTPEQQAQQKSDYEESRFTSLGRAILPGVGAGTLPKTVGPASKVSEAFQKAGVEQTIANQSKLAQPVSERLAQVPVAGALARRHVDRTIGQLGGAVERTASKLGDVTEAGTAGEGLKKASDAAVTKFMAQAEKRYSNLNTLIPAETKTGMQNTRQYLREVYGQFPSSPDLAKKLVPSDMTDLSRILEDTGELTFSELQAFRSRVGAKIARNEPIGDMPAGQLKELYGALSRDMEAVAKGRGKAAESAFNSANNFYRVNRQKIDDTVGKIIGAKSDEAAFNVIDSLTRDKGANIKRLAGIKARVSPGVWDDATGVVLRKMGQATAGKQNAAGDVFSPATFLTNWNKLDKQAKKVLFGNKEVASELDAIATVAERLKRAEQFKNTSRTGDSVITAGVLTGAAYDPVSTAKIVALGALGELFLTSPRALKAIRPMMAPSVNSPDAIRRTASMALTMYQTDPDAVEAITAYSQKLLELAQNAGQAGIAQP